MKLSRLLLISAVLVSLTSCDDLFEPALENNQDISEMYKDPTFARGILDNALCQRQQSAHHSQGAQAHGYEC